MEDNYEEKLSRVVAYVRKSSEDNEDGKANKQLNSLKYQREFINEAIAKWDLKLLHSPFEDDKTGYEAYVRDGFNKMMEYLREHKGEVDGIVCTEISRLARNFADGGLVLWYLQSGVIKRIYTPTKTFTNSSSDQLMVAIEFAMSKKSSDETGYRTKQGMRTKALTMKHPPRPAIPGYLAEGPVGRKQWIINKSIGPKIQDVFRRFATGEYTFDQITDYAHNIGIISPFGKNNKYSPNTWRLRLQDPQYTGIFTYDDERIVGEYDPLISPELFQRVQEVISGNQHPQTSHLEYAYSGIIACGKCGGQLSGTNKKGITYYRCGKRNEPCKSTARLTYIPEKVIEEELVPALQNIEIDEDTWREARNYVAEMNQPEKINLKKQIRELGEKISSEEDIQIKFGRQFANKEITKSAYDRLLEDSKTREMSLRNTIVKCENLVVELDKLMYAFLDTVKYVTSRLNMTLPHNKKELVDIFCENLVWDGEKLRWDWKKPYYYLAKQPKNSTVLPR